MTRAGFSLLEVLLALALIGGAVVALIGAQAGALRSGRDVELRHLALLAASAELESRRAAGVAGGPACGALAAEGFEGALACAVETRPCGLAAGRLVCPAGGTPAAFEVVVRVAPAGSAPTELRSLYLNAGRLP